PNKYCRPTLIVGAATNELGANTKPTHRYIKNIRSCLLVNLDIMSDGCHQFLIIYLLTLNTLLTNTSKLSLKGAQVAVTPINCVSRHILTGFVKPARQP